MARHGNTVDEMHLLGRYVDLACGRVWVSAGDLARNRRDWKTYLRVYAATDRRELQRMRRRQLGKRYAIEYRERRSICTFMLSVH